jgi:hypothetical protein
MPNETRPAPAVRARRATANDEKPVAVPWEPTTVSEFGTNLGAIGPILKPENSPAALPSPTEVASQDAIDIAPRDSTGLWKGRPTTISCTHRLRLALPGRGPIGYRRRN